MRSKINLVVLTSGFAADETDTTAFPALQMYLGNLQPLCPEIDVKIIAFHYPFRTGRYHWKGIPVFAAGGSSVKVAKIFLWIRILACLFRIKRKSGIDIIHAFWLTDTMLLGLLFRLFTRTPLVLTAMGQDVKNENRYLPFMKWFWAEPVFISEFQAEYNPELISKGNFRVIPFGIDPSFYKHDQSVRNTDIIGAGSLNRIKNYGDFIGIVKSVSRVIPGISVRIIGEGTERAEIEKLITEYGLAKIISLAGELPYGNVIQEMQSARILLHTSHFEGQGLVITEALASGAFVVSYPVGIAKRLNCKKLLTGTTRDELASCLISLLQKKEADHSPEIIFSIGDTCRAYIEIYHTLVTGKKDD